LLCSAESEDSTAIGTGDLFVGITHRDDLLFHTRLESWSSIVERRIVIFYQWKTLLNLVRAYTQLTNISNRGEKMVKFPIADITFVVFPLLII
jgi:hypothetical protein